MKFVGNYVPAETVMRFLILFCFYSYVILQFVVVRVLKEYAIIVKSLIFLKNEPHKATTFWGNISCAFNWNFNLFQRF